VGARYHTDEEEPRLMNKFTADEDRDRVRVLLHTGLRKSELLGLRWRDVDFKAGVDLLTIKELGGWKTLRMVERYAHLSPSHRQEAVERPAARRAPATAPTAAASAGAE